MALVGAEIACPLAEGLRVLQHQIDEHTTLYKAVEEEFASLPQRPDIPFRVVLWTPSQWKRKEKVAGFKGFVVIHCKTKSDCNTIAHLCALHTSFTIGPYKPDGYKGTIEDGSLELYVDIAH